MFLHVLTRIFMRIVGIRFYETHSFPKGLPFKKALFKTNTEHEIEFSFYKESCEDLFYRNGKIKKIKFTGYMITCRFDAELPQVLQKFQGKRYFFNASNFITQNEEIVSRVLLSVFLDHIKDELHQVY